MRRLVNSATSIDRIIGFLLGGDDHDNGGSDGGCDIGSDSASDLAAISQFIFGGDGDDHIQGGIGNDVLLSGSGSDDLQSGSDLDIVIGGACKDTLQGGRGDDPLIGGWAVNEIYLTALDAALTKGINVLIGGVGDKLKP